MKLTLVRNPVIGFPIEVKIFDENGEVQEVGLTIQYKRAERKKLKELILGAKNLAREGVKLDLLKDEKGKTQKWQYKTDEAFFDEYIVGWLGVLDESGAAIEYSAERRNELLASYPELLQPIFQGFFNAHEGAKTKN